MKLEKIRLRAIGQLEEVLLNSSGEFTIPSLRRVLKTAEESGINGDDANDKTRELYNRVRSMLKNLETEVADSDLLRSIDLANADNVDDLEISLNAAITQGASALNIIKARTVIDQYRQELERYLFAIKSRFMIVFSFILR